MNEIDDSKFWQENGTLPIIYMQDAKYDLGNEII